MSILDFAVGPYLIVDAKGKKTFFKATPVQKELCPQLESNGFPFMRSEVTVKELADALKRVINATQCNPKRPDIAAAIELLRRLEG